MDFFSLIFSHIQEFQSECVKQAQPDRAELRRPVSDTELRLRHERQDHRDVTSAEACTRPESTIRLSLNKVR